MTTLPFSRAWRRVVAPFALLAMLATACHHAGPGTVGTNDVNPQPAGRLQDGGTLNWPIAALPINYNYNQRGAGTGDTLSIVAAVMPMLFRFDATGAPSINPDYLTSAQVTGTSPQVVTYEINPKATWDDGTPITEADFEAQWRAENGTDTTYQASNPPGYAQIASVAKGKDAKEVVVTFRQPDTDWRGLFSPLYPASLDRDPTTFNNGWVTGTAMSAGPFVFQGLDVAAKTVTLVRDPKWWGTPARLYSIVYKALGTDPGTQLDALGKAQVDFVGLTPDSALARRAQGLANVTVRRAEGPSFRQLTLNASSPTLSDPNVRTAVALAIDRAAIARAVLAPLGMPGNTLDNHIFMANQRGYQANAGDVATPDHTRAASLLDRAGWKLSGGVRTRNGQPMSLRLVIPTDAPEASQEADLIKSQLQAVGVPLTVQKVSAADFFNSYVSGGDFDLTLFSFQGTLFPISSATPIYQSPTVAPDGSVDVHENFARIGNNHIDQLLNQAAGELDPGKDITLGNQIDVAVWKEVHSLTLYQLPQLVAQRKQLANFGALGFASIDYTTVGFTS